MPSEAEQIQTLGLMAAHESALADLYRAYAKTLPSYEDFFNGLAADEVLHARMLAGFVDDVKTRKVSVKPGRFSSQSILSSLDITKERVAEAERGEVSLMEALSTARDLEDGLIERKYFGIFEDDGPELTKLLERLAVETEAHRRKVTEAWERERGES
jgi:rubrerythrin